MNQSTDSVFDRSLLPPPVPIDIHEHPLPSIVLRDKRPTDLFRITQYSQSDTDILPSEPAVGSAEYVVTFHPSDGYGPDGTQSRWHGVMKTDVRAVQNKHTRTADVGLIVRSASGGSDGYFYLLEKAQVTSDLFRLSQGDWDLGASGGVVYPIVLSIKTEGGQSLCGDAQATWNPNHLPMFDKDTGKRYNIQVSDARPIDDRSVSLSGVVYRQYRHKQAAPEAVDPSASEGQDAEDDEDDPDTVIVRRPQVGHERNAMLAIHELARSSASAPASATSASAPQPRRAAQHRVTAQRGQTNASSQAPPGIVRDTDSYWGTDRVLRSSSRSSQIPSVAGLLSSSAPRRSSRLSGSARRDH